MIHYHGTPLTPRRMLDLMAGKNFCVSYAAPGDADWCARHGQSVMWDNGAFSSYTKGKPLDVPGFVRWVEPRLGPVHWAVIPDVIGGGVDEQRALIADWPHRREWSAPVWHMDLPLDWLIELAENWPRICFGSAGPYWQVGSDAWARRADAAWNALSQRGLMPWVHMMRGLNLCGDKWPFASADSVNVARNWSSDGFCPERKARMIDGRNSPIRWNYAPQQVGMFDTAAE